MTKKQIFKGPLRFVILESFCIKYHVVNAWSPDWNTIEVEYK